VHLKQPDANSQEVPSAISVSMKFPLEILAVLGQCVCPGLETPPADPWTTSASTVVLYRRVLSVETRLVCVTLGYHVLTMCVLLLHQGVNSRAMPSATSGNMVLMLGSLVVPAPLVWTGTLAMGMRLLTSSASSPILYKKEALVEIRLVLVTLDYPV